MRTYTVIEKLPDGSVRVLGSGLSLPNAQRIYNALTWAGTIVQEPLPR